MFANQKFHHGSQHADVGILTWKLAFPDSLMSRSRMARESSAVPHPEQNDVADLQ